MLQAELNATPDGDDEELPRRRLSGDDHPDTLNTRNNVALWTGHCGGAAGALALFRDLLPDVVRVLGPGHPATLTTRNNIAYWTGECGDASPPSGPGGRR